MNPLEKKIMTKVLCIDSLFRPNYEKTKSTDFTYVLPEHMKKISSIKISAIEIPNEWYAFATENKNNAFQMNGTTVTIPDGNYLSGEFVSVVGPLLPTGTITISSFTTKTTFEDNNEFTLDFSVADVPLFRTAGWSMGFRQATYTSVFNSVTNKYEVVSESSYGSSFDNYIFVEIDDYQNNFVTDSVVSIVVLNKVPSYLGKNIMARIPVNSMQNTIVFNNASDLIFKCREYFGPVRLERLRIRILNRFGEVINLNSNDFSMALEITELY